MKRFGSRITWLSMFVTVLLAATLYAQEDKKGQQPPNKQGEAGAMQGQPGMGQMT